MTIMDSQVFSSQIFTSHCMHCLMCFVHSVCRCVCVCVCVSLLGHLLQCRLFPWFHWFLSCIIVWLVSCLARLFVVSLVQLYVAGLVCQLDCFRFCSFLCGLVWFLCVLVCLFHDFNYSYHFAGLELCRRINAVMTRRYNSALVSRRTAPACAKWLLVTLVMVVGRS